MTVEEEANREALLPSCGENTHPAQSTFTRPSVNLNMNAVYEDVLRGEDVMYVQTKLLFFSFFYSQFCALPEKLKLDVTFSSCDRPGGASMHARQLDRVQTQREGTD